MEIKGYQPQSDGKVESVNQNKEMEEQTLRRLDELKNNSNVDQRWLAIGRTHIEQGWMAVNRAIFQPKRVEL